MHDFVTGASGFIGLRLCAALRLAGRRVSGMMRAQATGPWDDAIYHALGSGPLPPSTLAGVDTVYHLAARVHVTEDGAGAIEPYARVNVEGTRYLLEAALDQGVRRFVLLSSIKAMGEKTHGCVDESSEAVPTTPYGRTKREAELLTLECAMHSAMEAVVLRMPAVYGAGCKGNVASMLDGVRRRRFPPLPEFHNLRSMVHVEDVVRATQLLAVHPRASGQVYIVTDGEALSTRALYDAMRMALGREPASWYVPKWVLRAGAMVGDAVGGMARGAFPVNSAVYHKLAASACYSSERLRADTGFEPRFTLADGLQEMLGDSST